MSIEELREKLNEAMISADREMSDALKTAPNSFGHGYETGWRDALKTVLNTIDGIDDAVL